MFSKWSKLTSILFIVIFLEGYIVLASEILAIRQVTSYVGSGADTVSIIIAAVLMPLAFGYYVGGNFKPSFNKKGQWISIRRKLIRNVVAAACFLLPGLGTVAINLFFVGLFAVGISDRVVLTAIYSAVFLVVPVFLLGQTVPLISNYFSSQKLPLVTAKILFVSTAGSFMGSILTTIVIMHYFGVNNAVNFVFIMMGALVVLLSKKLLNDKTIIVLLVIALMLLTNSTEMLRKFDIVYNNAYNTAAIFEVENGKILALNGSSSSFIGKKGEKFPYVEFLEKHYISPISKDATKPPKEILVIGAAGFTLGSEDLHNNYTYVDIDPAIKEVAEKYFLKKPLSANKKFVGQDILSYLTANQNQYDMIVIDAYSSRVYIPEQLLTHNFFAKVEKALAPNGIVAANFIASHNFNGEFPKRLDNSFRSVFPHYGRQVVGNDSFDGWSDDIHNMVNIIYTYKNDGMDDDTVYTDNNNTAAFDKPDTQYKK